MSAFDETPPPKPPTVGSDAAVASAVAPFSPLAWPSQRATAADRPLDLREILGTVLDMPSTAFEPLRPSTVGDLLSRVLQLVRQHQELIDVATVDELTGALRRGAGMLVLQRDVERARRSHSGRLVVAFVDVDGLKAVNDQEGHAAGDLLLHTVSSAIRRRLRSYDLVIRYGGDEFVCAISDTDVEDARRRFDSVRELLGHLDPSARISVGYGALRPRDTADELIMRADAALYEGRSTRAAAGRSSTRSQP